MPAQLHKNNKNYLSLTCNKILRSESYLLQNMTLRTAIILSTIILFITDFKAYGSQPIYDPYKKYQAIVVGKITRGKITKSGNLYITEYKLKTKKWLFKKANVKTTKYITLKVLGADLKKEGIIIKASTTPDHIPINKEAVFFLEQNKLKEDNVFTVSKGGIIIKSNEK